MSDELRFDGRVAVVTGAGRELGRAHALLSASRGAKVVVNDLGTDVSGTGSSAERAEGAAAEILMALLGEPRLVPVIIRLDGTAGDRSSGRLGTRWDEPFSTPARYMTTSPSFWAVEPGVRATHGRQRSERSV